MTVIKTQTNNKSWIVLPILKNKGQVKRELRSTEIFLSFYSKWSRSFLMYQKAVKNIRERVGNAGLQGIWAISSSTSEVGCQSTAVCYPWFSDQTYSEVRILFAIINIHLFSTSGTELLWQTHLCCLPRSHAASPNLSMSQQGILLTCLLWQQN